MSDDMAMMIRVLVGESNAMKGRAAMVFCEEAIELVMSVWVCRLLFL